MPPDNAIWNDTLFYTYVAIVVWQVLATCLDPEALTLIISSSLQFNKAVTYQLLYEFTVENRPFGSRRVFFS